MARKENGLSDYELQRQANIAKNQALLKELQLDAASAGIAPKVSRPSRASTGAQTKRKPAPRVKKEEVFQPRRTSSRLKGMEANSEVEKRKADGEYEAFREAERAKRRRVTGELNLRDIVVAGQEWDKTGNWLRNVQSEQPSAEDYYINDAHRTSEKALKELREKMGGLELWEGADPSRIKITPERIGDKLGNLGLFDASQQIVKNEDDLVDELGDDNSPAITTFKPHTRTISSIIFTPSQPQNAYLCSYDSSIRKLDLEKGVATEVYAPRDQDVDEPLSGVAIPQSDPHVLYFTSLNGLFGIHDVRIPRSTSPVEMLQLSEKKIGGFSIHPNQPHLLATASLDRTLKLWDLRSIKGKGSERKPVMVAEHESRLSVSHAAFNSAGQIATSSYDDTIKIYSLNTENLNCSKWPVGHSLTQEEFAPSAIVKHNNQTGRWVTILRPHWQARPSTVGEGAQRFCIGNMNRSVDVYAGSGEQLAQLGGQGFTAVPAVAVFHESQDWIAGGTASGKLALWM